MAMEVSEEEAGPKWSFAEFVYNVRDWPVPDVCEMPKLQARNLNPYTLAGTTRYAEEGL
jgi:hypothetical protein